MTNRLGSLKGPVRRAIERVLERAEGPLSREEIAQRCGHTSDDVGRALSAMINVGDCYTDGRRRPARYTAEPPTQKAPTVSQPRAWDFHAAPNYVPKELRPFDGRPGAMDAYGLPSLVNGQRIARCAA